MRYGCAALGPAAIRARVVSSIARRRRISSDLRYSSLRKGKKLCKTAGVIASAIDHYGSPGDGRAPSAEYPGMPLWSYAIAHGGGMRAVARQATKGLLLCLRPYGRPRSGLRVVAPRQRQNQAKHNPIKYDAARLCPLSHQHRVYASDFNLLGKRLREASGARRLRLADVICQRRAAKDRFRRTAAARRQAEIFLKRPVFGIKRPFSNAWGIRGPRGGHISIQRRRRDAETVCDLSHADVGIGVGGAGAGFLCSGGNGGRS